VDVLDILRRQASRFQCPHCGKSLADCGLEMLAKTDDESLIRVTCAHCQDARLIAVAFSSEIQAVAPPVRDEPVEGPQISTDDVLDVRLVLGQHDGDLNSLLG
jgi:predicted RNA-binding Zn-ribbon protein involved in translation (DUF1610 family)